VLGVIPYETFPIIEVGSLELRTFGLMVGIGVLVGAWLAARYIEHAAGVSRDDTYRLATRMVLAGVLGARLTWDITHWDQIDGPLDLIAVWQGGLQFSGGFVAAVLVGLPVFRRWLPGVRGRVLDGYAYGLTLGLAIGRIGCYAVGEHFGSMSNFVLAVRYEGGDTREDLGGSPLIEGMTFHNTALYELLFLLVIFVVLSWLIVRGAPPGMLLAVFCILYGVARGLTDFVRVNDDTVAGLTGAQWLCVVLVPAGFYLLARSRRATEAPASGPPVRVA
jgi:phosphatidylglycerol:prolipoprotein diacylglycerol transferase